MKNLEINIVPQEHEPRGLRKCKWCGDIFSWKFKHQLYCSDVCSKMPNKLRCKRWAVKNNIHKKYMDKQYYNLHKDKHNKRSIEWKKSNPYKIKIHRKKYREKNRHNQTFVLKGRESACLRQTFGTSKVPTVCKKIAAIHRLLYKKGSLKLIDSISEGVTHEAYI